MSYFLAKKYNLERIGGLKLKRAKHDLFWAFGGKESSFPK
jgi:hypothetical protein